ncbi:MULTISPECIES: PLP-dependent cysteine synthase family protein [Enterococcus]|uniref:Cysteine synthase A n=1 Tax=Enterococcus dispar ATCC 51266 TaxID=1139219 RepID=S1NJN1_9ENTE|nr:cysteine synthase family protein [Enterococcus dispar]EOT38400.1 cysteine synthase A [Enterococcus dispar ATCC 51266]EOW85913.1 cysteine synthase A [Enterococcus dispar ATCC 51266]OJG38515.1 cysteine synthase A [Enterococcus dispar]WCG32580.1 cysteine synthase family protein [Enterococcus dispar]
MIVNQIKELIGNTPLLRFTNLQLPIPAGTEVFAKLEFLNPGGSIKDRLGQYLVNRALQEGKLKAGGTLIEPTAGNTGIGLALAVQAYDIQTIFVVPEKFSLEKQALMQALGATIVHTPTNEGMTGAIKRATELAQEIPNSYLPLQFENKGNPKAYYETLGPEIAADLPKTITAFVAGVGSGGTFAGTGAYLKEKYPEILLYGVEPAGSILNGGLSHAHEIEGIGVEFIPPFFENLAIAGYETIPDETGFAYTRKLAKEYGVLAGSSSGAALAAAVNIAQKLPTGSLIATVFPDAGDRYLSKDIYTRTTY